jgi:hypothetical protein
MGDSTNSIGSSFNKTGFTEKKSFRILQKHEVRTSWKLTNFPCKSCISEKCLSGPTEIKVMTILPKWYWDCGWMMTGQYRQMKLVYHVVSSDLKSAQRRRRLQCKINWYYVLKGALYMINSSQEQTLHKFGIGLTILFKLPNHSICMILSFNYTCQTAWSGDWRAWRAATQRFTRRPHSCIIPCNSIRCLIFHHSHSHSPRTFPKTKKIVPCSFK